MKEFSHLGDSYAPGYTVFVDRFNATNKIHVSDLRCLACKGGRIDNLRGQIQKQTASCAWTFNQKEIARKARAVLLLLLLLSLRYH
jgi:hypothetical protein